MRRYLSHQFPRELKIYATLLVASITTVITILYFLQIAEYAHFLFQQIVKDNTYLNLLITPLVFITIIYVDRKYCHFVGGSGVPQLVAANDSRNKKIRLQLLSIPIALIKILLVSVASFGGASISFGGPSAHIGGSIFYHFAHLIKVKRKFLIHSFIAIGGSAGLIIAFNAPIAGFLFAYEEIGRQLKRQMLILIAFVSFIVYLISYFYYQQQAYLTNLSHLSIDLSLAYQLIPLVILCAVFGGLFAKCSIFLINQFAARELKKVLFFVLGLSLIVAFLNILTNGQTAGSGYDQTQQLLSGQVVTPYFALAKFLASLASFVTTIAGGIFMTSISIGTAIGTEITSFIEVEPQIVMIIASVAYLSAVIRAPLSSAFLVLEMTNSFNLLFIAIIASYVSSLISKAISKQALYESLASSYLNISNNTLKKV